MSKFSVFIMGGAIGLLCSGSPAAMAQAMSQNVLQTNNNETKTPVQIPKEGDFNYKAKNTSGQMLTLKVKWKALSKTREDGSTPVSGDAKYIHPDTKMDSVVYVDQTKSYLTKEGKLFVAFTDFNGKLFGPIDVVKLKLDRLENSKTNTNSDNNTNNQNSSSSTGDKTSLKTTQNTDPSKNTDKPTDLKDNTVDLASLQSPTSYSLDSTNGGFQINDIFNPSGEFNLGRKLHIKWKQSAFIKGNDYPAGSKAVSFEIYIDQKKQSGWEHKLPSYIDKDGFVHIKTKGPKGATQHLISRESFLGYRFISLVKAIDQIKKEEKDSKKSGVKSLKGVFKNKKGEVVHTRGTAILGGVILSIGASNIADKKSPLAARAFDNIHRLLKQERTGWLVHRAAVLAGLKVEDHKTRGRSLVEGETSDTGAARPQYGNIDDIVENAPRMPWRRQLVDLVLGLGFDLEPGFWQQRQVRGIINNRLNNQEAREEYAEGIAEYLNRQDLLFNNHNGAGVEFRSFVLDIHINNVLTAMVDIRAENNQDTLRRFNRAVGALRRRLAIEPTLRITVDQFMDLLLRIPGFQTTEATFNAAAAEELRLAVRRRNAGYTLHQVGILPIETVRHIVHLMLLGAMIGY